MESESDENVEYFWMLRETIVGLLLFCGRIFNPKFANINSPRVRK